MQMILKSSLLFRAIILLSTETFQILNEFSILFVHQKNIAKWKIPIENFLKFGVEK